MAQVKPTATRAPGTSARCCARSTPGFTGGSPPIFRAGCARVLARGGRVIIFDVYVSATSFLVYQLHPERVQWRAPIDFSPEPPYSNEYYSGQGNATRMFFNVGRVLNPSAAAGGRFAA